MNNAFRVEFGQTEHDRFASGDGLMTVDVRVRIHRETTVAKKHPRKLAVHVLRWIVEGVGNGSALFVPAPLSRLDVKGDRPLAFVTALLTHASVSSPLHAVTPLAVAHLR